MIPKIEPDFRQLWETLPDYSLLRADEQLPATLRECYTAKAIKLRTMFLRYAELVTKERAEQAVERCPASIADDLFHRAGGAFEAHLRNRSLTDLRLFDEKRDDDLSPKLSIFFKPRDSFEPQSWETMQMLLLKVWDWTRIWRLDHYTYLHFACLALIEGQAASTAPLTIPPVPLKRPTPLMGGLLLPPPRFALPFTPAPLPRLAPDPRQAEDFIIRRTPDLGWHCACSAFEKAASVAFDESTPKTLDGLPAYPGAHKEAQRRYEARCVRQAEQVIESSLLKCLRATLHRQIIEEVGRKAREKSEKVDRSYGRRKETPPGAFWRKYDDAMKWTVRRVLLKDDWGDIADRSAREQDKIEKAVRKMLPLLHLSNDAAFFDKPGRKKIGKSSREK